MLQVKQRYVYINIIKIISEGSVVTGKTKVGLHQHNLKYMFLFFFFFITFRKICDIYRIKAVLLVETDIIVSIAVSSIELRY